MPFSLKLHGFIERHLRQDYDIAHILLHKLHFCFTATAMGDTTSVLVFVWEHFTCEIRVEQHKAKKISTACPLDFCTPLMADRPSLVISYFRSVSNALLRIR